MPRQDQNARPDQFALLTQRRFAPFFGTQFLGAFNDNLFKNSVVILITFHAATMTTMNPGVLVNLAGALFILPYLLFSALAGQIADKYEKGALIRLIKAFEVLIALFAAYGFVAHSLSALLACLFQFGLHSTLFGPVKYSILPQHLSDRELVGGNALVETGTFLAILVGTILAGVLVGHGEAGAWLSAAGVIAVALVGLGTSAFIPHSPPPAPALAVNWNIATETWRNLRFINASRPVFLAVLGISWFWAYGALLLSQIPAFGQVVLGGTAGAVTVLLAAFSVGVGAGSLACEKLCGGRIELGLVPLGAIGLLLFALDLALATPPVPATGMTSGEFLASASSWRMLIDLALLGAFGGFYCVPLYALLQSRSEPGHQARVIAGNNIWNALFMVLSALVAAGFLSAGLTIRQLIVTGALMNAAVAVYIFASMPEFPVRFLLWLGIRSRWRFELEGFDALPERGPGIIYAPTLTGDEIAAMLAALPRPPRMLVPAAWLGAGARRALLRACGAQAARDTRADAARIIEGSTPARQLVMLCGAAAANQIAAPAGVPAFALAIDHDPRARRMQLELQPLTAAAAAN